MKENVENIDNYQNEDAMILEDSEQDLEQTLDLDKELEKYKEFAQGEKNE